MLIIRKLIVDDHNALFDCNGMKYKEFPSDYSKVREYTREILKSAPKDFLEGHLLEQQLSEIIKNGIKHGNKSDPLKKIHIWYDLRNRARFIVEDEGEGFTNLEEWNNYYYERQLALHNSDMEKFLELASYRGPGSDENDGGNSLMAALDYWNGGIVYNKNKNKVGVIRWFTHGSGL